MDSASNGNPNSANGQGSYSISEISDLLGASRAKIYRWIEHFEQAESFRSSAEDRGDGSKYYPRSQWDALLASVGQAFPEPQNGHEVIQGELMPEVVGGVLAQMGQRNSDLQQLMEAELAKVKGFVDDLKEAEANLSEAEMDACRKAGAMKGIARFRIETQAEQEMLNMLRQKKMEDPN